MLYITTEGRAGSSLLFQYLNQLGIINVKKLSWGRLIEEDKTAYELLPAQFIHIMRHDKIQQAVSRVKHLMHNKKHVRSDTDLSEYIDREKTISDVNFPKEEIHDRIIRHTFGDRAWELFF